MKHIPISKSHSTIQKKNINKTKSKTHETKEKQMGVNPGAPERYADRAQYVAPVLLFMLVN